MITLFALPKPFKGLDGRIQRNALASWRRLGCDVVLLGDDDGVAEAAAEHGFRHVPEVSRTDAGTPRVDAMFRLGEGASATDLVCYVNADIILLSDFLSSAARLAGNAKPFLAIGRRWDIEPDEIPDPGSEDFEDVLRSRLDRATLHEVTGIDYFLYRKGLWPSVPPFAVGRTAWDNWLVWAALARRAELVDTTTAITAVHQNHGYGHVRGGVDGVWKGPEARRNLALAGGHSRLATLDDATARMDADGSIVTLGRGAYRRRTPARAVSRSAFLVRRVLGRYGDPRRASQV